ncbi:MAG: hypothetical protein IKB16_00650 [Lentisphaeria bacterium]|nr:hypothetical protein [Lentisphaeria bacterium]
MKFRKISGAIHAYMFCAFFISFLFRKGGYLLRNVEDISHSVYSSYLSTELLAFLAAAILFLLLALTWKIKLSLRLLSIFLLTCGSIGCWFLQFSFACYFSLVTALTMAVPLAVNTGKLDAGRLCFASCAVILAACFPNFSMYYAGGAVLITIIVQGEIPGIRKFGRCILAFLLLYALLYGAFTGCKKNNKLNVDPEDYRKNYELMMLAYAQNGAIPARTAAFFNHPLQKMNDLSAMVVTLLVDLKPNELSAYFAGDQLRYAAEYELHVQGKTPSPPPKAADKTAAPSVVLIADPPSADSRFLYANGIYMTPQDTWRNHALYSFEWLQKLKKTMAKNGILAVQLPREQEQAVSVLASVKKVFKNTVIIRWSDIYVFASDRALTDDPEVLDRNAVSAGIYKYMFAPYRILLFALPYFADQEQNDRLMRMAESASPCSLHKLPRIKTGNSVLLTLLEKVFAVTVSWSGWLFCILLPVYWCSRYWHAGIPGAKLSFQSFETGFLSGLPLLTAYLSFLYCRNIRGVHLPFGYLIALFTFTAMISLLFVRGKACRSFFTRILMLILCYCAFFCDDINKTLLCCIALLSGIAAVCVGQCPHRCRMPYWFLGMAAACLFAPLLWYSPIILFYAAACIILCYILFAGYKQPR